MCLSQASKCNHTGCVETERLERMWRAICTVCQLAGPPVYEGAGKLEAILQFWKMSTHKKEKPMTSDYRRGVEDATKPFDSKTDTTIPLQYFHLAGAFCNKVFDQALEDRRKKLLTKKETKWVILLEDPLKGEEYLAQGRLWDSKSAAERFIDLNYGLTALGVYPIEIEVPVD